MSEPNSIESVRAEVQREERLTADGMHGNVKRGLKSGCNDYLSQPIDATKLSEMFAKSIEQRK